jgi:hypothetical protein
MLLLSEPVEGAPSGHALPDDLESCFYILLRETLIYLPVVRYFMEDGLEKLVKRVEEIFNRSVYNISMRRATGGEAKQNLFLLPNAKPFEIQNSQPLTQLIADLRMFFQPRYQESNYKTEEGRAFVSSKYETATEFLDIFERALAATGWPEDEDRLKSIYERADEWQTYRNNTIPATTTREN